MPLLDNMSGMLDRILTFAAYAGSLRTGSYNKMLLQAFVAQAPPSVRIDPLDISEIPLFNMDLETSPPQAVVRMRERIRRAHGLLIVTPEHNGTIPAVTKTVIEWASRPPNDSVLEKKPIAIAGASTGYYGSVRAQAALRQIATIEEVYFMVHPEIRVAKAQTKFSDRGELVDPALRADLRAFLEAFAAWTLRFV